jgi:NAD(P)-dependent dehydrogenase (short-subunit alcohol dehydrogenase family)
VLVNAITPTVTETELMHAVTPEMNAAFLSKIPMGRFCKPEEVAATIGFLLGDDLSFTTGSVFELSGGRTSYRSWGCAYSLISGFSMQLWQTNLHHRFGAR